MSAAVSVPSGAIVVADETRAFEPSGIGEAMQLAKILVNSRLLPKAITTPEAAFTIIAAGRELGLTAMQSLRSIHVIEGKPSLSADLILALVKRRHDVCDWFRLVESTDKIATYETQRSGEPSPTRMSFTWEDAMRAQVVQKDNWRKYPAAMLRARCIAALARAVYPDLALGIYDPDELDREPAPVRAVTTAATDSAPSLEAEHAPPADDLTERAYLFAREIDRVVEEGTIAELESVGAEIKRTIPNGRQRSELALHYANALRELRRRVMSETNSVHGEVSQ